MLRKSFVRDRLIVQTDHAIQRITQEPKYERVLLGYLEHIERQSRSSCHQCGRNQHDSSSDHGYDDLGWIRENARFVFLDRYKLR